MESVRLRDEQDREYKESEEADRRNREKREKEEIEEKLRADQEQEEKELSEAIELSKRINKENRLLQLRSNLSEEPTTGPDVSMIRFQLPKGGKSSRRFLKSEKIQVKINFFSRFIFMFKLIIWIY